MNIDYDENYDCCIIGGGPAGLMAALYLARFCLKFLIIDGRESRAGLIPKSHNFPAFVHGINGKNLLKRLEMQLKPYPKKYVAETVERLRQNKNKEFILVTKQREYIAKTIILSTGLSDIEPVLPNLEYGIKHAFIKHCPICDGYESIGQRLGVFCRNQAGINEALFLKRYAKDISILTMGKKILIGNKLKQKLIHADINIIAEPILEILQDHSKIRGVRTKSGTFKFDSIYSALGAKANSDLATKLGAKHDRDGFLQVNAKQETSVKGLYAAGDVVFGLKQICVAISQAAIAATNINYQLTDFK